MNYEVHLEIKENSVPTFQRTAYKDYAYNIMAYY